MIVLCECVLSMVAFFVLTNRQAQRLSENAEDLHGSARWAREADIESTGLTQTSRGVYVGGWFNPGHRRLYYLRHNGPEHVLAFAPTRSGRGVGLVIPTLLAWDESAVIYDIKGENWAKTAGLPRAPQRSLDVSAAVRRISTGRVGLCQCTLLDGKGPVLRADDDSADVSGSAYDPGGWNLRARFRERRSPGAILRHSDPSMSPRSFDGSVNARSYLKPSRSMRSLPH